MKKQPVTIVGAGLAGLAAAYELSKHPEYSVTVLERSDRVGGRVHALPVAGEVVDFGGFLIYPWYKNYFRLVKELNLEAAITKIPQRLVYFQIDHTDQYYTENKIPFSKKDLAVLFLKMLKPVITALDEAEPPLENFNHLTVAEYFSKTLGKSDSLITSYTNTVTQGFCYPSAEKFRMSFMTPFIGLERLHGGLPKTKFLRDGADQLPQALAQAITRANGVIRFNTTVTTTLPGTVVWAQPVTATPYQSILTAQGADLPITWQYTHYYVATIKVDRAVRVQDDASWGGVFYLPDESPVQITSSINLEMLYTSALAGYINLNVVVRDQTVYTKTSLLAALQPQLNKIFPGVVVEAIVELVHWSHTMPNATEEFVQTMRNLQGKNNQYFAGDWLGSPSMETALTTGVRAAEQILSR